MEEKDLSQQEGGDDMVKGKKLSRLPLTLRGKDVGGDPGGFGHWMKAGYDTLAPLPLRYDARACVRGVQDRITKFHETQWGLLTG